MAFLSDWIENKIQNFSLKKFILMWQNTLNHTIPHNLEHMNK